MSLDGIPRRTVESDPVAELMGVIGALKDRVAALERGASLRNASISGGEGLRVLDANGGTRVSINTTDGAVVAYDASGGAVARFGPLANSNPGQYGVEVKYNGGWVQVGAGNVDWGNVSNKPSTFPPSGHTHGGGDIVSQVGSAAQADGSSHAYNNNVAGTSFYAVWVGNDGGYHFGRNTSSIRYKTNVREHYTDPANVLALTPVVYDRLPEEVTLEDGTKSWTSGASNEYGLIAEQVAEHFPELVTWYDGQIDGVRYDLVAVALLSVVRDQQARIDALEQMATTAAAVKAPTGEKYARPTLPAPAAHVQPGVAPADPPAPLPYQIQPPEGAS